MRENISIDMLESFAIDQSSVCSGGHTGVCGTRSRYCHFGGSLNCKIELTDFSKSLVIYTPNHLNGFRSQKTNLTFRGPCIVINSYNNTK